MERNKPEHDFTHRNQTSNNLVARSLDSFLEDGKPSFSISVHREAIWNLLELRDKYNTCLNLGDSKNDPHMELLSTTADWLTDTLDENNLKFIKHNQK